MDMDYDPDWDPKAHRRPSLEALGPIMEFDAEDDGQPVWDRRLEARQDGTSSSAKNPRAMAEERKTTPTALANSPVSAPPLLLHSLWRPLG
jgi:hypothetical protein